MNINDKIKQILIDKNLTPSYFADEIGVQRSSISHILSGRNRPSFDIIQKIIRRFPELGYEWIMEDENQGTNLYGPAAYSGRNVMNPVKPVPNQPDRSAIAPANTYGQPASTFRSQRNEIPAVMPPMNEPSADSADSTVPAQLVAVQPEKKVERILIFYTDGTFREYSPTS